MYYSRQVKDLRVLLCEDPKIQGRIKDVVIDWQNGEVKGFWLESLGLWKNCHFLSFKDIVWMNQKNVFIANAKNLQKAKNVDENNLARVWYGTPIYNNQGGDWGTLADILWTYPDGIIQGFAISQGILRDFKRGWYFLPVDAIDELDTSKDGIVLKDNCPYFNEVIRLSCN